MSPQNPRPQETSHGRAGRARVSPTPGLTARLALLLFAALAFAQASAQTGQTQTPAQPQPSPTPHVRPRKVAPKPAPADQTPQTPSATPPTQPATPSTQPASPSTQPARPAEPVPAARTADGQTAEEVDEDEVVRVDSNLVIIPASVVDARGRSVGDLKVEDFELKVDGEVKPIGELTRAATPVHVALLFDNSYSLSAAREFEKQAAVRFFRAVVRPIDRAAVYSVSTTPRLAQGLTNDVPRLVRTIEGFGAPDGATALFDAVAQASEYMRPLAGRKVLILVSDGTDTVSDTNFDDAVNKALRADCQVYVVQTRQVEDPNLHDPVSEQRMYRLTEQTGGAVFVPKSVEELDAVFTQISLDLSQQYLLSYYPQDERKDKYFRFISVRVKTRPALRVRARKGFYPDAAQAQQGGGPSSFPAPTVGAPPSAVRSNSQRPAPASDAAASKVSAPEGPAAPSAPARARRGPDGPDSEEGARTTSAVGEPVPTFTVTTSAPAAAPAKTPDSNTLFAVADSVAKAPAANESAVKVTPAASPYTTSPKFETASGPAPEEKRADAERREANASPSAAQPASSARPSAVEAAKAPVTGGVLNTKALSLPKPIYPAAARSTGASGTVVVEVMIDERGRVIEARAVSGHQFLQQAAVQAARLARFSPATLSGAPVKVKGAINYVFTLP